MVLLNYLIAWGHYATEKESSGDTGIRWYPHFWPKVMPLSQLPWHFRKIPRICNFIFVDLYGCVRLQTRIYLTLTTLYHSKIPLQLIKIKERRAY